MEMRSEKGKVLQLYNILLLLVKKKKKDLKHIWPHVNMWSFFFLGVKYTGIRSINLCTRYLNNFFPKCKEKAHRVFVYFATRSSPSAYLQSLCPPMFLASFLEGRRDRFYLLVTKKEKKHYLQSNCRMIFTKNYAIVFRTHAQGGTQPSLCVSTR